MRPATLKIIERPTEEPVTLSEAKLQVGLLDEQDEFDTFLEHQISAGRRVIEQRLGLTMLPTSYRAKWPKGSKVLYLPAPPLLEGSAYPLTVTVDDVELDEADYEVEADAMPAEITLANTAAGQVVVEYWAGHEEATDIEPQLRSALLMFVDHMFENRGIVAEGGAVELPAGFEMLLASASHTGGY